jgi:hypothetical protein
VTDDKLLPVSFPGISRKQVIAAFDGGCLANMAAPRPGDRLGLSEGAGTQAARCADGGLRLSSAVLRKPDFDRGNLPRSLSRGRMPTKFAAIRG